MSIESVRFMPGHEPTSEEDRFIEAVGAAPGDAALRLVYADWLEERGDARAEYLRAEVDQLQKKGSSGQLSGAGVDPVWAALVSRAPFGILVPGLTFEDTGPRITRADIRAIEEHWGQPLLPDYAAFLLRYNGGRPSKPYYYSFEEQWTGEGHSIYNAARFFSTREKHTSGLPYHLLSVARVFGGPANKQEEFSWMLPIGTLTNIEVSCRLVEGPVVWRWQHFIWCRYAEEHILALVMQPDEGKRIIEVEYREGQGPVRSEDAYAADSLTHLLMQLCDPFENEEQQART